MIERMFAKHEFTCRVNLTGSDTEGLSMDALWEVAPEDTRRWYESLTLGYTESPGHPLLRELAAQSSGLPSGSAVQVFAGATEAVFVLLNAILGPEDGVVVIGPTYQLLIDVPRAIGAEVTEIRLRREDGWHLDVDKVRRALRPNTRLIVANFPHNPTGALPEAPVFEELLDLVDGTETLLLSDEIYRGIELEPQRRLQSAAALTPNAISVAGVSKVLGMAGVRIGWTVTQNAAVTARLLDYRYWTTLATSAPSEVLAIAGLQAAPALLDRANSLMRANAGALASFVESTPGWDWVPPAGGTCAYPWLTATEARAFSEWLVDRHGVLLAPDVMFDHAGQHLRFGLGRAQFPDGMATLAHAWPEWQRVLS
ncbi:aspartate/methionine/tyrosine aminotransferase [Nonomuraea thailandensis]|uniref:Aspartate/methionine/tyrosine aminotransferase n=2 Tax=Nonomuraea thailandensis TaxID=1188745 RepID=A0A9X2G621_9ACTN|nr:aminotransferase class I/II-fold pyridoxal phosphate-dependent enzyme [Nonomuraea thailandensis]MCP2353249.1 aspartate/methionine/tyrosine aminotransferase [Nonomuraea thailandensis]